jgi:hypothetical protein
MIAEVKKGENTIATGKTSGLTTNPDGSTEIFAFDLKVPVTGYVTLVLTDDQGNSQQFEKCQGRGWRNGQDSFVTIEAPSRLEERGKMSRLDLPYRGMDPALYEPEVLKFLQQNPIRATRVSVTLTDLLNNYSCEHPVSGPDANADPAR